MESIARVKDVNIGYNTGIYFYEILYIGCYVMVYSSVQAMTKERRENTF